MFISLKFYFRSTIQEERYVSTLKWKVKEGGIEENWGTHVRSENQQNEPNILVVCIFIYFIAHLTSGVLKNLQFSCPRTTADDCFPWAPGLISRNKNISYFKVEKPVTCIALFILYGSGGFAFNFWM